MSTSTRIEQQGSLLTCSRNVTSQKRSNQGILAISRLKGCHFNQEDCSARVLAGRGFGSLRQRRLNPEQHRLC